MLKPSCMRAMPTRSKLFDKIERLIKEKYYIFPRGPIIPERANLGNLGTVAREELAAELEEFMRKRIK